MTKEEALQEFAKDRLDGFDDWEMTPLFTVWEDGDFPESVCTGSEDEDFTCDVLPALKKEFPKGSDISKLPTWCQIYLLLTWA